MFRSLAEDEATQPPQTLSLFPQDRGAFITYLGALAGEGVFDAKLSPYIPREGGALVTAWTVLMSMETGTPLLLCDSKRLTTERTAATTAIAVDRLAREDAGVLTIVGTGSVGLAHLRHVEALRPWREVRLCSPSAERPAGLPACRRVWRARCRSRPSPTPTRRPPAPMSSCSARPPASPSSM